jgi:phage terminase small subunit
MSRLTPKQEAFAHAVASGKSQSDAYRAAYKVGANTKPETVNQAASRIMADSNVTARVAELRKPIAEKAQVTLEGHLRDLMMLRNMAVKEKQIGAAITAEIARGKAAGVHVERSESFVTTRELPASVDEFV